MLNLASILVAGAVATVALTAILEGSVALGQSRMSLPYLLGTIFTHDRRKAHLLGMLVHAANGLVLALAYGVAFETFGRATWWVGALLGVAHAALVLSIVAYLPAFHPRMATEQDGPEAGRALQPPGPFALHYGVRTPLVALAAHMVYGAILGWLYHVG